MAGKWPPTAAMRDALVPAIARALSTRQVEALVSLPADFAWTEWRRFNLSLECLREKSVVDGIDAALVTREHDGKFHGLYRYRLTRLGSLVQGYLKQGAGDG